VSPLRRGTAVEGAGACGGAGGRGVVEGSGRASVQRAGPPVQGAGRGAGAGGRGAGAGGRSACAVAARSSVERARGGVRRRRARTVAGGNCRSGEHRETDARAGGDDAGFLLRSSAPRSVAPSSGPRRRRVSWWATARQVARRQDLWR
jgi:hypothetical protein